MRRKRHPGFIFFPLTVGVSFSLALLGCGPPTGTGDPTASTASPPISVPRISFGTTTSDATAGQTRSFVLESTPDLVLHATLPTDAYEGQTLTIRGESPTSVVVWAHPRIQKGRSLDAALRVVGSTAARRHLTGRYTFHVTAPDGAVVAEGSTTFTSRYPGHATAPGSSSEKAQ